MDQSSRPAKEPVVDRRMNDAVKIALISAVCSIITALITASVQWKVVEDKKVEEIQEDTKDQPQKALPPISATTPGEAPIRALFAQVKYNDNGKTDSSRDPSSGFVHADICVLTMVSSYGGASKTCNLAREEGGWSLTATARKATATCRAACFDIPTTNSISP